MEKQWRGEEKRIKIKGLEGDRRREGRKMRGEKRRKQDRRR